MLEVVCRLWTEDQGQDIAEQEPQLLEPARMLSACQPFPWSRKVYEANHCVFNMIPCDNDFEKSFARFLDDAEDISAFAKLPQPFGFSIDYVDFGMNLRSYYPDFVALDSAGQHWLIETKGMESSEVSQKDAAAENRCENVSALTGKVWRYRKFRKRDLKSCSLGISRIWRHCVRACTGNIAIRVTKLEEAGAPARRVGTKQASCASRTPKWAGHGLAQTGDGKPPAGDQGIKISGIKRRSVNRRAPE
jgi:hypothetical protein